MRLYDTARRAGRAVRAAEDRAHVRVRHHAVRLDAPRSCGDVSHLRPARSAGSRTSATKSAWCATSPTSTTRSFRRRGSSAFPYLELAEAEMARFHSDMDALDMRPPIAEPRATEAIDGIIELVGQLLESGHAYLTHGTAYFDVSTFPTLRQPLALPGRSHGAVGPRARRQPRRSAPAFSARLRAVAAVGSRRARVARAVRCRPAGLAHRVLGDGDGRAWPHPRPARWRHRPDLSRTTNARSRRASRSPVNRARGTGCTRRW